MKRGLYLLAVIAVLAAVFIKLEMRPPAEERPADKNAVPLQSIAPSAAVAPPPAIAAASGTPAGSPIELLVRGGRLVSGPTVIKVAQGDDVTLQITSDAADELHLHGYDLHLHLVAGEPAILKFTASRSGRFEYELHHAHADLGALEVYPR